MWQILSLRSTRRDAQLRKHGPMERCVVGRLSEFAPGSRKIATVGGRAIGVFNIREQFYALRNRCPHQGAPLCLERVKGTTLSSKPYEYVYGRNQEIIQCPWHGWEFEIATGRTYFNPHRAGCRLERTAPPDAMGTQPTERVRLGTRTIHLATAGRTRTPFASARGVQVEPRRANP